MARSNRDYFDHGSVYHIYNKVVTGEQLFQSDSDYIDFLDRYLKYFSSYVDTYAYCLIPNHFHFLIKVKDQKDIDLSKEKTVAAKKYKEGLTPINSFLEHQLGRMLSGVTIMYNKKNSRVGPLFKTGTKRVCLRTESRIAYQLYYIHHNPIHHGLSRKYTNWQYSSYSFYLSEKPSQIDKKTILNLMGGKDIFIDLHEQFKLDYKNQKNTPDW